MCIGPGKFDTEESGGYEMQEKASSCVGREAVNLGEVALYTNRDKPENTSCSRINQAAESRGGWSRR